MSPLVPYTEKGANFRFEKGPTTAREHLLYSVEKTLRLHHDGDNREYLIAESDAYLPALAIHKNRLVHAEARIGPKPLSKILYTETGELIAERPDWVLSLAVQKKRLVDAGEYKQILYTETEKTAPEERTGRVFAIAVHDGRLVHAGPMGIHYTESGERIAGHIGGLLTIAVHKNRLVHALSVAEDDGIVDLIYYTEGNELIAKRRRNTNALATYKGRLIDAGDYEYIFYTGEDEPILKTDGSVLSLLPIGDKMADSLLKLPEVREIR
jgi:hypothetical protein